MEFPSAQWSDVTRLLAGDYLPRHKVYHHHNHHNLNVTNTHVSYTQTDIISSYSYTRIFDDNDLRILSSLWISRLCTNIYVPERAACQGLSPTDTICTVYCYRYHAMCISVHLDFSHLNSELTAVCTNIPTNVDKSLTCLCWSHETIVTCHVFGEEEKRLGVKHNTSSYE